MHETGIFRAGIRRLQSKSGAGQVGGMKELLVTMFLPLLGTSLGAAMVFLLKNAVSPKLEKALLGFAAGVMIAASVWSLLIPSIDMAEAQGGPAWLPALLGFLAGVGFLLLLDSVIPHLHLGSDKPEGVPAHLNKTAMLLLAVTLHNIPEGMAVGVAYAGARAAGSGISGAAALALSLGIAIQNFPEGAIISLPLRSQGAGRGRAFALGVLSGAVEPAAGLLTVLFVSQLTAALPYLLAFAAGAMLYVVIEELIPESQTGPHSNIGTVGAALGFALMMVLDVALG